ncbi:hypothetical protein BGZ57DRAFT_1011304 [Hyaloscypha finlandica]|nr:hypothetical protein BGZ57DRAFT_1011304 [Hyaloscypha finlandica]
MGTPRSCSEEVLSAEIRVEMDNIDTVPLPVVDQEIARVEAMFSEEPSFSAPVQASSFAQAHVEEFSASSRAIVQGHAETFQMERNSVDAVKRRVAVSRNSAVKQQRLEVAQGEGNVPGCHVQCCDPSRCCDLSSNLVSVTVATLEFHQRKSLLRARPVHEGRHCCSPNHLPDGKALSPKSVTIGKGKRIHYSICVAHGAEQYLSLQLESMQYNHALEFKWQLED